LKKDLTFIDQSDETVIVCEKGLNFVDEHQVNAEMDFE